jgi:hypothetical protein
MSEIRRLAAILAAGASIGERRGASTAAIVAAIEAIREANGRRGPRVVRGASDTVIAECPRATDAVACAVAIRTTRDACS